MLVANGVLYRGIPLYCTRCMYSQCMPRAHLMTFEQTGDMCTLLLVGVASDFGMVGHVQQV